MRTNERKGSIVVLVAVLMVVLLGFGAFAIDISQMQAYKSELRRTADAAVLAATLQLLHETQHDSARAQADRSIADNPVFGGVATVTSFSYGRWSDSAGFVPLCSSGCSAISNAIQLELTGPEQGFYLARLFGQGSFSLSTQVTAWLPVVATPCAAPFAILLANWPTHLGLPSEGRPPASTLRNSPQLFTVKRMARATDAPDSTYGAINLPPYPSDLGNGVDNYALNLSLSLPFQPACHRLQPTTQVQAKIGGYNQETIVGTGVGGGLIGFCAPLLGSTCYGSGGQVGRAVRIPIVQPVPPGSACLTTVIFPEDRLSTGGALCYEVVDVGTFVIVAATMDVAEAGAVTAQYAGRDTIGPARGYAQRPILVQ